MWRCALAGEGNWQVSFFKKEKQKKLIFRTKITPTIKYH